MSTNNFIFRPYKRRDFTSCAELIASLWTNHLNYKGLKDPKRFYHHFFLMSLLECDHREVVVDDGGEVVGFFLGTNEIRWAKRFVRAINLFFFNLRVIVLWFFGYFGIRSVAVERTKEVLRAKGVIFEGFKLDSEIVLFVMSPACQGKGIGKQLMARYFDFCRKQGIHSIILLTDCECNFGYYDHNGFKLYKEDKSDFFPVGCRENNVFSYVYEL